MRKRQSAGTAQPAAGRAYNGLATGDSQIHQVLRGSGSGAGLAGMDPQSRPSGVINSRRFMHAP
jgi:hypothetical protein